MAKQAPDDPMALARERWTRSAGANWRSFDQARSELELKLAEIESIVAGLSRDPEFSEKRKPEAPTLLPKGKGIESRRVRLNHEALTPQMAARIRERLYHPDLDLFGLIVSSDLLLMVVNALGERLEDPARRGNRSIRGSKKGGATTRDERAAGKAAEDQKLIQSIATARKKNPNLKSARSLAKAVAKYFDVGEDRIRKRIAERGLAPKRAPKSNTKKMG